MHLAKQKQADQIWVVNVGDMKPLEIPIEYFISLGYDFDTWGPINKVMTWATAWAQREFGAYLKEDDVKEVADIIDLYGFYANRKKYEALNTTTFHLYNYNEAETVLSEWADLADRAWAVYKKLPKNVQPSFCLLYTSRCV